MAESLLEVQRLAQAAHALAQRVDDKVAHHEDICGERYAHINEQLADVKGMTRSMSIKHDTSIEKIFAAIDALKTQITTTAVAQTTAKNTSDMIARIAYILIGIGGIVYGVTH